MGFRDLVAATVTLGMTWPAQALAQDILDLEPSSSWALNYADEYCELARAFGDGDRSVTLALRSYEPEGRFHILLSGPLARPASSASRIGVEFADLESWEPTFTSGEVAGRPVIMLKPLFSFGPLRETARQKMEANAPVDFYSEPEIEVGIETLGFIDGLEREFVLNTGSMGPPMAALRECTQGIADNWGVTFPERQSLTRIAVPVVSGPVLSRRHVEQYFAPGAFISILLIVAEDGSVADCTVRGTNNPADAESVCERMGDRMRFEPALGADGSPAKDYWLLTLQR